MEIGSFLELQFPKGREFYSQESDIIRLNTGRAAIRHAFKISGCRAIWLPVYQCDSVREALMGDGAEIKYYNIDSDFNPINLTPKHDEAVLFVNYYGIMSYKRMTQLAASVKNAIIDNCQAFFCKPVDGALNIYSCRKFVGVPDGAYVIGKNVNRGSECYPQGYSSDTALFLLTRIEYGCEGKGYQMRKINEDRIDAEDIMLMSPLTRTILDGTDYDYIIQKRRENFMLAHQAFGEINKINPMQYYDDTTVPMVYPLVVENDNLIDSLFAAKHFQGHWWSYICDEQPEDTFEHWLSRFVIPITIDQRYGKKEIDYLSGIIHNSLNHD
ncbi:MAG: hypothetical protein K2O00_06920 [Muribaculaceae bacterium]|nr:hypothetical protein [Muribaculaceae bacterium]